MSIQNIPWLSIVIGAILGIFGSYFAGIILYRLLRHKACIEWTQIKIKKEEHRGYFIFISIFNNGFKTIFKTELDKKHPPKIILNTLENIKNNITYLYKREDFDKENDSLRLIQSKKNENILDIDFEYLAPKDGAEFVINAKHRINSIESIGRTTDGTKILIRDNNKMSIYMPMTALFLNLVCSGVVNRYLARHIYNPKLITFINICAGVIVGGLIGHLYARYQFRSRSKKLKKNLNKVSKSIFTKYLRK